MAEILDPLSDEQAQPLASMLEMIFVIAFLAVNGHHLLLKIIHRSYELFPPGKIPPIATLAGNMLDATSMMLVAGLQLASPILAALLVLLVALAILARIVPEMDIFFISFPLRIFLGLAMLVVFAPFITGFVEMAKMMVSTAIVNVIRILYADHQQQKGQNSRHRVVQRPEAKATCRKFRSWWQW
jgi:flagellar biosynthetic protein FliR